MKQLSLNLAYTYADGRFKEKAGHEWTRSNYLPRNKFNLTVSYKPIDPLTAYLRVSHQGEVIVPLFDPEWNLEYWEEEPATVADMAVTYAVCKNLDIWIKVENLFDKEYTESAFTMPGRWFYVGTKLSF